MAKDDFKFYVPISLKKATPKDQATSMILEGLAGGGNKDTDGESLSYKFFDMERMFYVNWEHSDEPVDLIGVILEKNLKKNGQLFLKAKLFDDHDKSKEVYDLQKRLEKEGRTLGFSVEGKVIARDPINPKVITKAELYGVSLCRVPVNPVTYAKIVKSFSGVNVDEEEEDEDEVEKMTTETIAPLMKESVEKKKKNSPSLKKSEVYIRIFNTFTKNALKADLIYDLIKSISNMENGKEITEDTLKKAREILGLVEASESGEGNGKEKIEKAQGSMQVEGTENGGGITTLKKAMDEAHSNYIQKAKEYGDLCKAKGQKPDYPGEQKIQKGEKIGLIGADDESKALLKSVITEALVDQFKGLDEIKKGFDVKTKALGELITSNSTQTEGIVEDLKKAQETIEKIQTYNDDFRTRLNMVEKEPVRRAVTTENYKERFEGDIQKGEGVQTFSLKSQKADLVKSISDLHFNNMMDGSKHSERMMELAAKIETTGMIPDGAQRILKSEGIEVIA